MTSMAREAVTTSYITTKLRRIPNGLLGSNERTSLSHEHLPSFPLCVYIYIYSLPSSELFRRLHPLPSGSRKWDRSKSDHGMRRRHRGEKTWMRMAVFHPFCARLSAAEYFFTSAMISRSPSKRSDSIASYHR